MKKNLILKFALAAISILFSLGLLEFALRAAAPLYPSVYQPDATLLYKLVPGAKKVFVRKKVNGGQRLVWSVNSEGFRGDELRPNAGQIHVLVYGDSNVEGEFSELDRTFCKQLELRLASHLTNGVEAINAGVSGYGPDQASLRLAGDLERFRPDLVILCLFADNDFGDLLRNKIYVPDGAGGVELNPDYRLAPDFLSKLERAAFPAGIERLQLVMRAKKAYWRVLKKIGTARRRLSQGSSLLEEDYIEHSLQRTLQVFKDRVTQGGNLVDETMDDYYDVDIAVAPESPSAQYKRVVMDGVLARIRQICDAATTPLLVVILPSPLDACEPYDYAVDPARHPGYRRERISEWAEALCAKHGIPAINLWAPFRETDANQYYFHGGDDHWNDAGQAQAAEVTAQRILGSRLLK